MTRPECRVVDLTPEDARELLAGNTRNRSLRGPYVKRLAGAMTRGEWMLNGEPIQVAHDGTLLNGQHRLWAVVESGVTIPALIVSGLPVDSLRTLDAGARRNLSDVLSFRGETDTTSLGSALGFLHRYRRGGRLDQNGHTAPTAQEALKLLESEPELRTALREARSMRRQNHMRLSVMAVLLYLFNEADPGAGTSFFEALCTTDTTPRSPIRALQSILARERTSRSYRLPAHSLFAMTIKAFNAWREGTPIEVLAFKGGGEKPEPFPQIRSSRREGGPRASPAPDDERGVVDGGQAPLDTAFS